MQPNASIPLAKRAGASGRLSRPFMRNDVGVSGPMLVRVQLAEDLCAQEGHVHGISGPKHDGVKVFAASVDQVHGLTLDRLDPGLRHDAALGNQGKKKLALTDVGLEDVFRRPRSAGERGRSVGL